MQDLKLINAIKHDDENAFEVLFKKYYANLVNYINVYTYHKSTSEDIVQQLFITLWTKRKELNITKSVKGYLYTVAQRDYLDYYRSLKRKDTFFDELKEIAVRNSIDEDEDIVNRKIKRLKEIIDTLPPKCKEILELNKLSGLKYQEIAKHLGISVKTVESQMRIAYQRIREGFENDLSILFFLKEFISI
ncbi:RNA polymerase sigma factor [Flavivirga jejuensis]|uniref:RNA polymerase sigma-70 factor n=1 Tax=Flavivirga jejuensis TaxID=870487 RepID=A0ABT8WQU9_9FLAO|nr:RNA polymerase sigma-70 factor [Flavivirga jejuensis]MDO5975509.1 RNA polymerase sigma-70 factor [Flavivirga jejuensis]